MSLFHVHQTAFHTLYNPLTIITRIVIILTIILTRLYNPQIITFMGHISKSIDCKLNNDQLYLGTKDRYVPL